LSGEAARRILEAARSAGLGLRMLADREPMGSVEIGTELEVTTVDHVAGISVAGLARLAGTKTTAVLLPGSCVAEPGTARAPARALIDRGCAVALGTDFSPLGCAPRSMSLVMALARICLGMTPEECVIAATINAACTLGLDHAAGTLHVGKRADFVALDLPSYRALGDVLDGGPAPLVVVRGEPVVANVQDLEPGL
jgi:imidazolonepropionase